MNPLGRHLLIELYDCDRELLNDAQNIEKLMCSAAEEAGATIVSSHSNLFNPYGVSGVVVIAESHVTIHTWPEHGYAAVDVFTCGENVNPWVIQEVLEKAFSAKETAAVEMQRGLLGPPTLQKSVGDVGKILKTTESL